MVYGVEDFDGVGLLGAIVLGVGMTFSSSLNSSTLSSSYMYVGPQSA